MSNNTIFTIIFITFGLGVIALFLKGATSVAKQGMKELREHDEVKKRRAPQVPVNQHAEVGHS